MVYFITVLSFAVKIYASFAYLCSLRARFAYLRSLVVLALMYSYIRRTVNKLLNLTQRQQTISRSFEEREQFILSWLAHDVNDRTVFFSFFRVNVPTYPYLRLRHVLDNSGRDCSNKRMRNLRATWRPRATRPRDATHATSTLVFANCER